MTASAATTIDNDRSRYTPTRSPDPAPNDRRKWANWFDRFSSTAYERVWDPWDSAIAEGYAAACRATLSGMHTLCASTGGIISTSRGFAGLTNILRFISFSKRLFIAFRCRLLFTD